VCVCVCVLLPTLCKRPTYIEYLEGLVSLHFSLSKEKIQCVLASRPQGKGVLFASSLKVRVIGRFFFSVNPPSLPLSPSLFFCLSPSHVCALKGDVCYWTLERRRKTTTKTFFFIWNIFCFKLDFLVGYCYVDAFQKRKKCTCHECSFWSTNPFSIFFLLKQSLKSFKIIEI